MADRPKNEQELQQREAVDIIRASRFVRKYAHSGKPITLKIILGIHKEIFEKARPDIGGTYRTEDIKITGSKHRPPHFTKVPELMLIFGRELEEKLKKLVCAEGEIQSGTERAFELIDEVVYISAWIHHSITFIYPFVEGNGRTARLSANLILEHYGLLGISVKIEKENKNAYCKSLAQIDEMGDYEPLVKFLYDGLMERYDGVAMKYYVAKSKKV